MKLGPILINARTAWLVLAALCCYSAARPFIADSFQASGPGEGPSLTTLGTGLTCAVKLIVAGICFAIALVDKFAWPATSIIDLVYGLSPNGDKPPLDLTQAQKFISHQMPEAAEREYRRLLEFYPKSKPVWSAYLAFSANALDTTELETRKAEARRAFRFDRQSLEALGIAAPNSSR